MKKLLMDRDRYRRSMVSPLAEAVVAMVQDRVRQQESPSDSLPAALSSESVCQQVEDSILATGYRFDWSASISVDERPDIYRGGASSDADFSFSHPDAELGDVGEDGLQCCGHGDNVVRHSANVTGVARYIRTNERVLKYLTEGVPDNTIAIIDDSGGTLTAPIIEHFKGVICAGGTVRSHLGILTREYNIPCLMNAKVTGIKDGDTVVLESSAEARTAEDYQESVQKAARVWRVNSGEEV